MSAVSWRPVRAAQKLITTKTEMRMMIFTISAHELLDLADFTCSFASPV
jgi:hypothetical protein